MTYKILLANVGYFLGLNGSLKHYFLYGHRYLYCPERVRAKSLGDFQQIVEEEQPDLCCIVEIETPQLQPLVNTLYVHYDSANKYGPKSFLKKIPFFKNKSNAFLSKEPVHFQRHFLKHGHKRLVYEVILKEELSLFLVHFSLNRQTRRQQFLELKEWIKDKKEVILAGDFNIFRGFKEIDRLLEGSHLKLINAPHHKTFPAHNPKLCLDLFICSENITVRQLRVIPLGCSDHLPVVLEIEI